MVNFHIGKIALLVGHQYEFKCRSRHFMVEIAYDVKIAAEECAAMPMIDQYFDQWFDNVAVNIDSEAIASTCAKFAELRCIELSAQTYR